MAGRLVVLAFSEASPVLIDSFCAAGKMPVLTALRERGLVGRTRYAAPYLLTPQMWATVLTGRNAGSHGVFDYRQRSADGRFRELCGADIQGPTLIDAFDDAGLSAGFVNLPMTSPPRPTRGFILAGQDAPGAHPSIAQPPQLYHQLVARFGRYRHKDIFPGYEGKAAYARTIPREVDRQAEVLSWIAASREWDFLALYTSGTAFAQHYFWSDMQTPDAPFRSVVEETYRASDRLIGRIAEQLHADDRLFVISECGAGPIRSGVRLNSWLEHEGFLTRSRGGASASARVLHFLRKTAPRVLPKRAFHLVNRPRWKAAVQSGIEGDGVDWARTRAFHRGKGEGNVYLRLRKGEPGYEETRDGIAARLQGLRDPSTGVPAVRAVHRREDLYSGPFVEEAPDLIVEWDDFAYMPCEGLDVSPGHVFANT